MEIAHTIGKAPLLEVIVEEPGSVNRDDSEGSLESDWVCCATREDDFVYCDVPCVRGFTPCYMVGSVFCVIGCIVALGVGFWQVWDR